MVNCLACGCVENFMGNKRKIVKEPRPAVIGTGLIALDVFIGENGPTTPRFATGGTCGNVLINLAFMGWNAYPMARIQRDWAGALIAQELHDQGVYSDYLHMEPTTSTPIIIHRIKQPENGDVTHSFSLSCPHCGRRLPWYQPVTLKAIQQAEVLTEPPQVFFFDRPSAGAIHLAREAREKGAMVFFEFAGKGAANLLGEAFGVADIVKYSHERASSVPDLDGNGPYIQIMTEGKQGLSYRCKLKRCKQSDWKKVQPHKLSAIKDAAGAGDWCTAGLISRLGGAGRPGLDYLQRNELVDAFQYAQALAAINCCFEGARGSMAALSCDALDNCADHLVKTGELIIPKKLKQANSVTSFALCQICGPTPK